MSWQRQASEYVLSLPERVLRSTSALAGGLLRQISEAALPVSVRRTRLYRSLVEAALRFLVEQVGEVEGVYPAEGKLAEDFLLRRAAGNGLELIGILTFRASPVWVFAALADLTGAGRSLLSEIARALREEGLLDAAAEPQTLDQLLVGLERTAGRTAEAINTPPLDVGALRKEWRAIQREFQSIPGPGLDALERQWSELQRTAREQGRSVFELSSVMALSALTEIPSGVAWLSRSAQAAAGATGGMIAEHLLAHYSRTLSAIREEGFPEWWTRQFRPYLRAAAMHFSPGKRSLTQRLLGRR